MTYYVRKTLTIFAVLCVGVAVYCVSFSYAHAQLLPDLIPINLDGSGVFEEGETITFSIDILNDGDGDMGTGNTSQFSKKGEYYAVDGETGYTVAEIDGSTVYIGSRSIGDDIEAFDVSDPGNPTKVSGVNFNGTNSTYGVEINGNTLYTAGYGYTGLSTVNISNPAGLLLGGSASGPHGQQFANARYGNYIYTGRTGGSTTGNLSIYDVSNQLAPVKVGGIEPLSSTQSIRGLEVSGSYLYVVLDNDNGNDGVDPPDFLVFDLADPTNPAQIASLELYPGCQSPSCFYGNYGLNAIEIKDNYAFVGHDSGIFVFDISDPHNPTVADDVATNRINNIRISGTLLYAFLGYSGVVIYDISDPTNIVNVGNISYRYANDAAFTNDTAFVIGSSPDQSTGRLEAHEPYVSTRFCIDRTTDQCYTSNTGAIEFATSSALAIDESVVHMAEWVAVAGDHTIVVCTDIGNHVQEIDDSTASNCVSYMFNVSVPAPTATIEACNLGTSNCFDNNDSENLAIYEGDEIEIHWNSTNAASCALGGFDGTDSDNTDTDTVNKTHGTDKDVTEPHNADVPPSKTYAINCDSAYAEVIVDNVSPPPSPPVPISIEADKLLIRSGDLVTLTWNIAGYNAGDCTIDGPGTGFFDVDAGSGQTTVTHYSTFTLTCDSESDNVSVRVTPRFEEQ